MDGLMDRSNRMNPYRDFSHRIYIYTVIFLVIFSGFTERMVIMEL
jgi:hypothetical protein